jgi:hypothetical protein
VKKRRAGEARLNHRRKDLFQGNDSLKGQQFLKRMKTSVYPARIHQLATPHFVASFSLTYKRGDPILPLTESKFLSNFRGRSNQYQRITIEKIENALWMINGGGVL